MKVERMVSSGQIFRQPRCAPGSAPAPPAVHAPQHVRAGVLKRHVEIGQHLAVRHQRDDLVDVRVGIDVVQPHPDAELAERASEIEKFRPHLAALPLARGVFDVDAIGRGILRDDQQLLHPAATSRSASHKTSAAGRETRSPRSLGMMQKVQRLLQPSEIFR